MQSFNSFLFLYLRTPTAEYNVVEGFGRRLIQFEDVVAAGFLDKLSTLPEHTLIEALVNN